MDHALTHRSRSVWHDPDDRKVLTGHLLNAGDGQTGCHAAQHETLRTLVQREFQRLQQRLHHLRLDGQKDQITFTSYLSVGSCSAAKLFGQCLCLGRSAVGQINFFRVNGFAHSAGNCTAHVSTAQKTNGIHHNETLPRCRRGSKSSACFHSKQPAG